MILKLEWKIIKVINFVHLTFFVKVAVFNLSNIAVWGKLNCLQTFYDCCALGLKDIGKVICEELLADLKNI